MTLTPLICWGATGQAKVLREFLPVLGYQLIACFDNNASVRSPFADVPLVGDWRAFATWRRQHPEPVACVVAIGGARGVDRTEIQKLLVDSGLQPVSLIHPTAFVAESALFGAGTQILAMSAVCVDARLGEACIINTAASVDHDCTLGNGVHVGPGATLCGSVLVDDWAFVGAGATILPHVQIGRGAIIGAGAVVARDVLPGVCVVGVPARIHSDNFNA
jgi:sugar O-acyltransferase (sialic acid O-acetyltransferase NeuD family)